MQLSLILVYMAIDGIHNDILLVMRNRISLTMIVPSFRVIGSLSQFGQFAEDFMCSAGSQMRPIHPCVIW